MDHIGEILHKKLASFSPVTKKETVEARVSLFLQREFKDQEYPFFIKGSTLFIKIPDSASRSVLYFSGEELLQKLHDSFTKHHLPMPLKHIRFVA